jgi:hypothetical protein
MWGLKMKECHQQRQIYLSFTYYPHCYKSSKSLGDVLCSASPKTGPVLVLED